MPVIYKVYRLVYTSLTVTHLVWTPTEQFEDNHVAKIRLQAYFSFSSWLFPKILFSGYKPEIVFLAIVSVSLRNDHKHK